MLLLLVILAFFLVFTGVSCNQANTKKALSSIDASQGVTGAQAAQVNACVNSLSGVNILTYSGWQLVFGKDPVVGSIPAPCNQANAAATDTSSANIGPQILAFLALACAVLGLVVSMLGALGLVAARSRALVTAIFSAGAGALLILDQFHVHDVLFSKISSSEGSGTPGLDPTSLFTVNAGIGLIAALVILGVAVVYNVAALVVTPIPVADATPEAEEIPTPEEPAPDANSPPDEPEQDATPPP
jgi:hypothetical protein